MRREKFLEKISQDERVQKIEYSKRFGYVIELKNGYGVLNTSSRSNRVENTYFDYFETTIVDWARESSQDGVEWFLSKVEKVDDQELVKKNKEQKLNGLKRLWDSTNRQIYRTENNIKSLNENKAILEKRKNKIDEFIKELEQEE